jgi:hypothetical protein
MEENIGLVVLEHLRHKLNIHILDVDFLQRVSIIGSLYMHSWSLILPGVLCSEP